MGSSFSIKPSGAPAIGDLSDWPSDVSATEVSYLNGVTSNIQDQLDNIVVNPSLSDISDWPGDVSATEVGYLDGVTAAIQTQFNNRVICDTQANRPAAGISGRIFIPNDGYYPAVDNGSSWDVYPQGLTMPKATLPPDANTFTAVNCGSTTLVDHGDVLLLTMMGTNSTSEYESFLVKSVPSAPYSLIVGFDVLTQSNAYYTEIGVVWSDGTSNPKFQRFTLQQQNAASKGLIIARNSNLTTWNSSQLNNTVFPQTATDKFFMKLADDNTNRTSHISMNGNSWWQVHASSRTDYFTPTHIGVHAMQATTAVATNVTRLQVRIFHWSLG